MATDLERLSVLIEANTKSYERSMLRLQQQTDKAIRGASRSIQSLDGTLLSATRTARTFAGAFGVGFGLAALPGIVRNTVKRMDDLGDAATRAGVSAEKLQVLRFVLEQGEGSAEQADAALQRFNKSVGEAALTGKGPAAEAFRALGIAVRDSTGAIRANEDLFTELALKFPRIESGAAQAAIAARLFGKEGGPALATALAQGTAGIDAAEQKLRSLNALISNESVKAFDPFEKRFNELALEFETAMDRIVLKALQTLEKIGQMEHSVVDSVGAAFSGTFFESQRTERARESQSQPDRVRDAFKAVDQLQQDSKLLAALQKKLTISPDLTPEAAGGSTGSSRAPIVGKPLDLLAAQERAAADAADQLREAQDRLAASLDEVRNAAASALDAFAQSIAAGEGATAGLKAALVDVLQTIIRIGEQQAIASLFGGSGTSGGGLLGGVLGGIFGGGSALAAPGVPSLARAGAGSPTVVQLVVGEGQVFEPRVRAISGAVVVQHTSGIESRAVARGPAVARDNQRRFGTP